MVVDRKEFQVRIDALLIFVKAELLKQKPWWCPAFIYLWWCKKRGERIIEKKGLL